MKKPGRNDLCSCGSGKKYKNCCVSEQVIVDQTIPPVSTAIGFHQEGRIDEAQKIYETILEKHPHNAEALHFLGVIHYQKKNYPAAEQLMRRSIAIKPSEAIYHCNFGMLLRDLGQYEEAVKHHRKALVLQPNYAEAHLNLGVALFHLEQLDEAARSLRQAIQLQPGSVKAYDNLGTVLRCQYDYAGAISASEQALKLDPNYVAAYTNLAATYIEVKNFAMASAYALKAIDLDANNADAFLYVATSLQEQGDLVEAERFFLHAATLAPDNKNTQWNLAITRLALGNLDLGWEGYEYRWTRESGPVKSHWFPYPIWQGEVMPDKTILIWGEQGIGDEIMFSSMLEEMVPCFKKCVLACNKKLIPLFSRSFPEVKVVDINDRQQIWTLGIDVQSAAGSLARWLRPTVASFPKKSHFLIANDERVEFWKRRLAEGGKFNVGICWRSGNLVGNRLLYCTLLEQWGSILSIPGVRFINLQYDDCATELNQAKQLFGVDVQAFPEVDLFNDIDESAALTKALDLVISAPTSTAILAAALGVPTWMMLTSFEWQKLGTPELCWYSTAKLFAKRWDQPWDVVIDDVANQLVKTKNR